ncbi:DUF554 domain-containing protein [Bulleidia sp. zg-1006]|uniref:DUF554 domain-containing protein n=1 Tax=Bulleidia sp. zg-1006 TaxID=2806552 RepID=UPI0019397B21|nr:DUF554 domain-containing protein [Bulleidia sp. zg-1006]QRG87037.1 DUF554 domain-containing protein [Bulleidia sp. zg-1006]
MFALGTFIDTALGLVGGIIGLICGPRLNKNLQEVLLPVVGLSLIILGLSNILTGMIYLEGNHLRTQNTMLLLAGLPLGTLIGEILHIQRSLEYLAEFVKKKSGNTKDPQFVQAFLATTCMIAIGAMGILGCVQDALGGDHSLLICKGIVDLILVSLMSASLGKGAIFANLPMFLLQISFTAIFSLFGDMIYPKSLTNLTMMGGILIMCIGLNVAFDKKIRVMNLLPALLIALFWLW